MRHSSSPAKRQAGIRADLSTIDSWKRKAKQAGMSFNAWACLVLDQAPQVVPAKLPRSPSTPKRSRAQGRAVSP